MVGGLVNKEKLNIVMVEKICRGSIEWKLVVCVCGSIEWKLVVLCCVVFV